LVPGGGLVAGVAATKNVQLMSASTRASRLPRMAAREAGYQPGYQLAGYDYQRLRM
jgi:hypothetical protein